MPEEMADPLLIAARYVHAVNSKPGLARHLSAWLMDGATARAGAKLMFLPPIASKGAGGA